MVCFSRFCNWAIYMSIACNRVAVHSLSLLDNLRDNHLGENLRRKISMKTNQFKADESFWQKLRIRMQEKREQQIKQEHEDKNTLDKRRKKVQATEQTGGIDLHSS
jgi:hypothetical protein